jgi:hypothetical protein
MTITALRHQNVTILKCTVQTGRERHREVEILEDDNVLVKVKATLTLGDTLVPLISMSD